MILFEGNISAGKSTLGKKLAEGGKFGFIEEPVSVWQNFRLDNGEVENLLGIFYKDMHRWSFFFQMVAFATRAKTWDEILAWDNHQMVALERSVFCDRNVFALNCFQSGLMERREWQAYCLIWDFINSRHWCARPDLVVYVHTPAETCYERMLEERGRPEETDITLAYLRALEKLHDDWLDSPVLPSGLCLINQQQTPVLKLNGERPWATEELQEQIEAHLPNRQLSLLEGIPSHPANCA